MSDPRSALQKEANELDLEMFRLAGRLEWFAEQVAKPYQRDNSVSEAIYRVSNIIVANRAMVRAFMHVMDIEATE